MTDPTRPQPVLKEFDFQGAASGLIVAIGGIVLTVVKAGITTDNLVSLATLVGTAVSIIAGAALWFSHHKAGQVAAAQVTPLESPQTYGGQPLMTAEQWIQKDQYGEHAGRPAPVARPVPSLSTAPYEPYQQLKANADALDTPIYAATVGSELIAMAPVQPESQLEPEPELAAPSQPEPMEAWAQRVLSRKSDSAEDKAAARAYLDSLTAGK